MVYGLWPMAFILPMAGAAPLLLMALYTARVHHAVPSAFLSGVKRGVGFGK